MRITLEIDNPGQFLLMLIRAHALLDKRANELANCRSCDQGLKQGLQTSTGLCAKLLQTVRSTVDKQQSGEQHGSAYADESTPR